MHMTLGMAVHSRSQQLHWLESLHLTQHSVFDVTSDVQHQPNLVPYCPDCHSCIGFRNTKYKE